ncbi:MAG: hypothetical protein K8I27_05445 [Planctomycetes bacterium]|nr:hypothetical protein [Planctomycetota bacterium]
MAEKGLGSSGSEWTAGIIAIVAALLLGGAVPVGVYAGLYKPKEKERVAAEQKLTSLDSEWELVIQRQDRVRGLEDDAEKMAERLTAIEAPFALADVERMDVTEVRTRLLTLADKHHLELLPERQQQLGSERVYIGNQRISFPKGLHATKLIIEARAYYHDFGRFVTELETLRDPADETKIMNVIIPEKLICKGDPNGGSRHVFILHVFVVEKRDINSIGR